ncbi:MAG: hypothetical protein A2V88_12325 [Elusimicrobia bacterium RBG_16_66_12]|nr:MAG: hypothetical protein A2V88_12325 [Elusimicrobia bacterium RBG_16_66_12]
MGTPQPKERAPQSRPGAARVVGQFPRALNVAWASITDTDLQPGELVFDQTGNALVYRMGRDTIFRFDNVASRTI